MFLNRNKLSFLAHLLATLAGLMVTYGYLGATAEGLASEDSGTQAGTAIAAAILLPGVVLTWIGVLLGWLGFFLRVPGLSLTASIVYIVAGIVGILGLILAYLLPSIILGFMGWAKENKLKKA
jgi:hypothetical protein